MGVKEPVFDFKTIGTGFFTVSGAMAAVERFFIHLQFSVIAHGFFFHPVILEVHAIAKNIVYGNAVGTGRKTFLTADSAVMLAGLALVFRYHLEVSPVEWFFRGSHVFLHVRVAAHGRNAAVDMGIAQNPAQGGLRVAYFLTDKRF